jgi:hypothetical protein
MCAKLFLTVKKLFRIPDPGSGVKKAPDPGSAVLWIRIHFFRIWIQSLTLETNTDPDYDPIRIQGFNDQKLKKNYS